MPAGPASVQEVSGNRAERPRIEWLLQKGTRAIGETLRSCGRSPFRRQHDDRSTCRVNLATQLHEKVTTVGIGKDEVQNDQIDLVPLEDGSCLLRCSDHVYRAAVPL